MFTVTVCSAKKTQQVVRASRLEAGFTQAFTAEWLQADMVDMADMADMADCDRFIKLRLEEHGSVDFLDQQCAPPDSPRLHGVRSFFSAVKQVSPTTCRHALAIKLIADSAASMRLRGIFFLKISL